MIRKSPQPSLPPYVRRNKSLVNNNSIKFSDRIPIKEEEDEVNEREIADIENILDKKIKLLNETFKTQKEEDHINNITKLLEIHLNKTNEIINDSLDKQKRIYDEREIDHRQKYEELLKRYNKLYTMHEDDYFKFTKLISHYQFLIFKVSNTENIDNTSHEEIKKVLEFNSIKENEKRESLITNPITSRRYTNPVIKRSHVNVDNKYNAYDTNGDSE